MANVDKVYVVVRSHCMSGKYPEDFYDYGDDYIGAFNEKYEARKFIQLLPPLGEKDEEHSDEDTVIYERPDDGDSDSERIETYRYKIESVPYLSY